MERDGVTVVCCSCGTPISMRIGPMCADCRKRMKDWCDEHPVREIRMDGLCEFIQTGNIR